MFNIKILLLHFVEFIYIIKLRGKIWFWEKTFPIIREYTGSEQVFHTCCQPPGVHPCWLTGRTVQGGGLSDKKGWDPWDTHP